MRPARLPQATDAGMPQRVGCWRGPVEPCQLALNGAAALHLAPATAAAAAAALLCRALAAGSPGRAGCLRSAGARTWAPAEAGGSTGRRRGPAQP
eukprot:scaffold86681_cov18-Tisochrysis_lutea.AAC.1